MTDLRHKLWYKLKWTILDKASKLLDRCKPALVNLARTILHIGLVLVLFKILMWLM